MMENVSVVWVSDPPGSPTGFGMVTDYITKGLDELGYRTKFLDSRWISTPLLLREMKRIRPDFLVTLINFEDAGLIALEDSLRFIKELNVKWLLYLPLDSKPVTVSLKPDWMRVLLGADKVISPSRFGQEILQNSGLIAELIPHGVDVSVFCPPPDKEETKSRFGYEGKFVILSDSRNQPRKNIPDLLEIASLFCSDKTDVIFHLHTDPCDPFAIPGYDLRGEIFHRRLGKKVRLTEGFSIKEGIGLHELAKLYQAADVHLLTSWGEGFGLPTLQACASGVVPFAGDHSANRELITGHGELIEISRTLHSATNFLKPILNVRDCVEKLQAYYRVSDKLEETALKALEFSKAFSWTRIVAMWDSLLQYMMS